MRIPRLLIAAVTSVALVLPANAASLIRDAEIERTLRQVAKPLLQKAGLASRVSVLIVNDPKLNAFVAGGNSIFINSGLIRRLSEKDMLQAVIAHEISHMTGGHISQRVAGIGSAKTAAGLGLLLGIATALGTGNASAGVGLAIGSNDAARKNFLAFTRSQEASADQSGARLMASAGIDPASMLEVINLFRGQEMLNIERADPYVQTHPLSAERLANLQLYVKAYKTKAVKPDPSLDYWYKRTVAKFDGFMGNPKTVIRKAKKDNSEFGTLRRAVAYHRLPHPKKALIEVNKLLKLRPNDPFYHELRGQFLIEIGDGAGAIKSFRQATKLAPKEPLILAGYGRALLTQNTKTNNAAALKVLKQAYAKDPRDGRMLRDLGLAYARAGNNGMAAISSAERYAIASNFKQAKLHANRAQKLLPQGTAGWLRAQDIIATANRFEKRKK